MILIKQIKVIELAALLDKALKFGYGDRAVRVSDDEECNGYHCLFNHNFGSGEDVEYLDEQDGKMKWKNTIIID